MCMDMEIQIAGRDVILFVLHKEGSLHAVVVRVVYIVFPFQFSSLFSFAANLILTWEPLGM